MRLDTDLILQVRPAIGRLDGEPPPTVSPNSAAEFF